MSSTAIVTDDMIPPDPIMERRALIQGLAVKSFGRRKFVSSAMVVICGLCVLVSLIPLFDVLLTLIQKGLSAWSWAFFTQLPVQPTLVNPNDIGGVGNAILGSAVIDGIAAFFAVPLGIVAGLFLAEKNNHFANALRATTEVLTGLPSILLGIFAYSVIILRIHHFAGIAGSFALGILMMPVIMKAGETAIRGVPNTLREAGLALGARQSKVSLRVVLPYAMPGLITGVLLALARAVGETAPILFVIGASTNWNLNPTGPLSAMTPTIFNNALNGTDAQKAQAWGIALFLVVVVLTLSLASRLVAAWMRKERR